MVITRHQAWYCPARLIKLSLANHGIPEVPCLVDQDDNANNFLAGIRVWALLSGLPALPTNIRLECKSRILQLIKQQKCFTILVMLTNIRVE